MLVKTTLLICLWINLGMSMKIYTDTLRLLRLHDSSPYTLNILSVEHTKFRLIRFGSTISSICKMQDVQAFNIQQTLISEETGNVTTQTLKNVSSVIKLWDSAKIVLARSEEACMMSIDPATLKNDTQDLQCSVFQNYVEDMLISRSLNNARWLRMEFKWSCNEAEAGQEALAKERSYPFSQAALIISILAFIILLFVTIFFFTTLRRLKVRLNVESRNHRLPSFNTIQNPRLNDGVELTAIRSSRSGLTDLAEDDRLIVNQADGDDAHAGEQSYIEMGPGVGTPEDEYLGPTTFPSKSASQELYENFEVGQ